MPRRRSTSRVARRQAKPKKPSLKMELLERFRSEIVVLVVLPVSLLLWFIKIISRWINRPDPGMHNERVTRVAKAVQDAFNARSKTKCIGLRTDRSVYDSHSVRNADKKASKQIRLRDLRAILGLKGNIVHVEPGVTVGEITDYLLKANLQLECCLEMEDATLGGLAMSQGMTTHSHICGLLSDTVTEYEVVTGNGTVLTASKDENEYLFKALPLSHGTLGFLVSLKLRVVKAKAWVELRYTPCRSFDKFFSKYMNVIEQARKEDSNTPFFVEGIAFGRHRGVLMEGRLLDEVPPNATINRIGWFWKPWFFKHVESMLQQRKDHVVELIPIREYLMRHDRSMCMTMATIIPYGNHWLFRLLLGWLLPPQMSFLKSHRNKETREASMRKQCYQDVAFPADKLGDAMKLSSKLFGIFPLMVYPCKVINEPGALLRVEKSVKTPTSWFLNLGIYGIPPELSQNPDRLFPMVSRVRELEAWLRSVGGFQHTYCDSFQTEEEFEEMFDHTLYNKMRLQYAADGVFPKIFEKTRPEIDFQEWLEEEATQSKMH